MSRSRIFMSRPPVAFLGVVVVATLVAVAVVLTVEFVTGRSQRPRNERGTPARQRDRRNVGREGSGDGDRPEPNHGQDPQDESDASSSRPPSSQTPPPNPSVPATLRRRTTNENRPSREDDTRSFVTSQPEIRSIPRSGLRVTGNTPETLLLRPIPRHPTFTPLSAPTIPDVQTSHYNSDSLHTVSNVAEQPSRPPLVTPQTSGSAHDNFVSNSSSQLEDVQSGLHSLSEEPNVPHPIDYGPSVGVAIDIPNTSSVHRVGDSDNSVTVSSVTVQRPDTPPVLETEDGNSLHIPQNDVASHLIGITERLEAVANIAQVEQAYLHSGRSTPITSPGLSTSSLPDDVSWPNSPGFSERSLDPEIESTGGQRTPVQGSPSGTPINSPRTLESPLPPGEQLPLSFENLERHGLSTLQLSATLLTDYGMMADGEAVTDGGETDDGTVSLDNGEDMSSEDSFDIVSNPTVRSVSSSSSSSEDWEQIS